ncbi:hypothetical protein D3C87_1113760 [compost metagenome]
MKKPWEETHVYAWSVEKLPEILSVSDEMLIIHSEEAVQVFAKPLTRLSDILATLYEHFSHLGYVPFELIPNADETKPVEGDEE